MIGLAIFATILGVIYSFIQLGLRKSWLTLQEWSTPADKEPSTSVVVIIPARNEAVNIKSCIQSILVQEYPEHLMQIIAVDDHSEDRTLEFARSFEDPRLTVVALEERELKDTLSPKKRALGIGINESDADLIITTDADCKVGRKWLASIVSYFENNKVDMIAGPVLFDPLTSSFEKFQALDFIGMMGVTGAGIHSGKFHMCNGANLAFSRSAFLKVDGYKGTEQIASGDDILLAQKFAQHPDLNIGFLKSRDAVVYTKPVPKMMDFLRQRLRWGAKSEHYSEKRIIWIQFIVLFTCLALTAFTILGLVFMKWHWKKYLIAFSILFSLKSIADFASLRTYTRFFNRANLMSGFLYGQFAHIIYICIAGTLSVFVREHEWKGRRLK